MALKAGDAKEDPFEKRIVFTFDGKGWSDFHSRIARIVASHQEVHQ